MNLCHVDLKHVEDKDDLTIPRNANAIAIGTLVVCGTSLIAHCVVGYATVKTRLFRRQLALRTNFYISLAAGLHLPYFMFGAVQQLLLHQFDNIYVDIWALSSDVLWYSMMFLHVFLVFYRVLIVKSSFVFVEKETTLDRPIICSFIAGVLFAVARNARPYNVIDHYDLHQVAWVSRGYFQWPEAVMLYIKLGLMTAGIVCTAILMRRIIQKRKKRMGLQELRTFLVGSIIFVLLFLREFIRYFMENLAFCRHFWPNSNEIRNLLAIFVVCLPPYLSVIINSQLRHQVEGLFFKRPAKGSVVNARETTLSRVSGRQ